MLSNLAFSLSLYSGQMCTTPQNLLIPRDGIRTEEGPKSYDEVVADLAKSVGGLLGDDARANALLGAIVNPDVKARLEAATGLGEVALPSREISNPEFPNAVVRTPLIVKLDGAKPDDESAYMSECFGPVSFAVAVDSAADAVELLRRTIRDKGAMTVGAYTTDEEVEQAVQEACLEECAQLSLNLTGGVYVNQTAAFSDFHGSGGNPAANAALCDGAFVANRFRVVEVRREA
jgi:phenylacetic acid degradation protein paaN